MSGWRQATIAGKAADVWEPSRPADPALAVLFLHGHALTTLRENPIYTDLLREHGLRCVCPHGARSWWGDRVCREFDPVVTPAEYLRQAVVPWIWAAWGIVPPQIGLLGVSMGGQGALRIAYRWPDEFPVVAALSPAVDFQIWHGRGLPLDEMYESAEAARQDTATLRLHPLHWPRHQLLMCDPTDAEWFAGVERLASKLASTGIPFEADLTTRRGGHSWEYLNHVAPRAVAFLCERLQSESRRAPLQPLPSAPETS